MAYQIEIRRSRRRTLAIEIPDGQTLLVRAPVGLSQRQIQAYLARKQDWIQSHMARLQALEAAAPPLTKQELAQLSQVAALDLPPRARGWGEKLGVELGRITIRCQKSRWGSCSGKGNLNFNCLLMLCPEEVREYVALHEVCHRLHMDHSPAFWALVARQMPQASACRQWLRRQGPAIMARRPRS